MTSNNFDFERLNSLHSVCIVILYYNTFLFLYLRTDAGTNTINSVSVSTALNEKLIEDQDLIQFSRGNRTEAPRNLRHTTFFLWGGGEKISKL